MGAHDVSISVEPQAFTFGLSIEQLQTLNRSHSLDERRVFLCLGFDNSLATFSEHTIKPQTHGRIEHKRGHHHDRELGTVKKDHRQGGNRHQAVNCGRDHALGKRIADWFNGGETRQDVTDMAFLKIGNRQSNQMVEQAGADLEVQDILHHKHDQRTDGIRSNLDRDEQSKANCKYHQQIDIISCDDVIHRELQVKWAGNHKNFQDHR